MLNCGRGESVIGGSIGRFSGMFVRSICTVNEVVTSGSLDLREWSLNCPKQAHVKFTLTWVKLVLVLEKHQTFSILQTLYLTSMERHKNFPPLWNAFDLESFVTSHNLDFLCKFFFLCYRCCKGFQEWQSDHVPMLVDLTSWGQNSSSMIVRHHMMVLNPRGADLVAALQASR